MAKFKICMKRDAKLSSDAEGMQTAGVAAAEKTIIMTGEYLSIAVAEATRQNHEFYPVSWECIEPDVKTPEQLAEEEKNRKIVAEYLAKKEKEKQEKRAEEEKSEEAEEEE